MSKKENLFDGFSLLGNNISNINDNQDDNESEDVEDKSKVKPIDNIENDTEDDEIIDDKKKVADDITKPINTNEDNNDDDSLKPFADWMAKKGILDIDDDYDGSEEGLEKAVLTTVEKRVNEWKSSYGEETNKFLEFVENGGNPKDFINYYYNESSWEDFKPTTEDNQKIIIKESLKLAGWEDDEIESEIKDYEDLGKLEQRAETHLKKLQKAELEFKKELVEQQKANKAKQIEENKKMYEDLKKSWFDKEDLNGFKLNKQTKEKVWEFIYQPDKKTGKTKLQESYLNNQDSQFMYAYLAMNNFDIAKLEKQVETKAISKLKQQLNRYTDSRSKLGSGRTDREEDTGKGFEGFSTIKK